MVNVLQPMTRCGSIDLAHRTARCAPCKAIYNASYRKGAATPRALAQCAMCGLTRGNTANVHVRRYALIRSFIHGGGRKTSVCIGSLGMCDRCVVDNAKLSDKVRVNAGAVERDDGLRAYDSMPVEWAS